MSLLRAFAWTAILESFSWIFLLASMFFTYVVETSWGDGAISLFGRIHGYLVIAYLVLLIVNSIRWRWTLKTAGIDALALLVPGLGFWVAKQAFAEDRARRAGNTTARGQGPRHPETEPSLTTRPE